MKVLNDNFVQKLGQVNDVIRRLRQAGVNTLANDFGGQGWGLLVDTRPPETVVPVSIAKRAGKPVTFMNGVQLKWGEQ